MSILQDIRSGLRTLGRSPVFTVVAILSLGLGIGAGISIFSLANAILFRSLLVPKPHELRRIMWSGAEWEPLMDEIQTGLPDFAPDPSSRLVGNSVSLTGFRALREQCATQADVFGFSDTDGGTAQARHDAFIPRSLMVSGNFFSGLGVRPLLGRLLNMADERAGAAPVVVISYRCWEQQFDLAPAVIGQSVALNGFRFTVAGVLPREFPGVLPGTGTDFYASLSAQPQLLPRMAPDSWSVRLMARLKPGVSEAQFRAALGVAFMREAATVKMKDPKVWLTAGRTGAGGRLQPGLANDDPARYGGPLWLLLGLVGLVLLVTCANLAGLMLARGT
ncbi:MAG: ABC transporter permease, partial [Limisphaerales bacterium]